MTNIYNKGCYRSGEWAKHLRPFLKKVGNRRWRRTTFKLVNDEIVEEEYDFPNLKKHKKQKKIIEVKFKLKSFGNKTYSHTEKYSSLRAANDAVRRNNVIHARIIND